MSGSEEENRRRMIEEKEEEDKGLVMDNDNDVDLDDSLDDDFSSDFKNYIKSTNVNRRHLKPMAAWIFWTEVAVLEYQSPPMTPHSSGCRSEKFRCLWPCFHVSGG